MGDKINHVLSFDLATRSGWAMGAPDDLAPISGSQQLRRPDSDDGILEFNIGALFIDLCRHRMPDLVVWETPMTPEAWFQLCQRQGRPQNGPSLIIQNTLAGVLKRECWRKEIPFAYVARQTIMKHYTGQRHWNSGKGKADGRAIGKKKVLERAIQLGHLPKDCRDDDRGDAIALWDYARSMWGGYIPPDLPPFFDEGKMQNG